MGTVRMVRVKVLYYEGGLTVVDRYTERMVTARTDGLRGELEDRHSEDDCRQYR